MKKWILILMIFMLILSACSNQKALEDDPSKITIYYFHGPGCFNCDELFEFLDKLKIEYSDLEVKDFDLSEKENEELLSRLANAYDERIVASPALFVADQPVVGFGSAETTGLLIEDIIKRCQQAKCLNPADILKKNE